MKILFTRILICIYNYLYRPYRLFIFKINIMKSHFYSIKNGYKDFNSDFERKVEVKDCDLKLKTVLLTCYFTSKKDPQTGKHVSNENFEYIKSWYESVNFLKIDAIIFYDELSSDFINKYQTKWIQFRKCNLGNFSIFEERWIIYSIYISKINPNTVFVSDVNDVIVLRNYSELSIINSKLFIGKDSANRIKDSAWLWTEYEQYLNDSKSKKNKLYKFQYAFNCGLFGGDIKYFKLFLFYFTKLLAKSKTENHKDMTIFNLVIFFYLPTKLKFNSLPFGINKNDSNLNKILYSGFPFNSEFKKYQYDSNNIFVHK
jgi:hypothetical protein